MEREIKFRFIFKDGSFFAKRYKTLDELLDSSFIREEMEEDINSDSSDYYTDDYPEYEIFKDVFTGLKDKNGVEIYEGDVIVYINDCDKDKNKNIAIIEFSTNNFRIGFKLNPIKETEINFGEDVDGDCCIINFSFYDEMGQNFTWDNLEVIGNIYENPELLEGIL